MRIAATAATLLFALASCSTTESSEGSDFLQPNQLMAGEINNRIEQIPYQHRDELLQNLLWLGQAGEQSIPALLVATRNTGRRTRRFSTSGVQPETSRRPRRSTFSPWIRPSCSKLRSVGVVTG